MGLKFKPKIAILGLGYVGLPLAIEFSKKFQVVGFDISQQKITQLKEGIDSTNEISSETLKACNAQFTNDTAQLQKANVFIITVPTPIDTSNKPDLSAIKSASKTVGKVLKKGAVVVYESTVYPGVSEDICVPILEEESGLKFNQEFFLGYSPERISPGDKERTLTKIMKIVSGSTPKVLEFLTSLYGSIITAGIYQASSIKVAEAAKVIENTQRDLNVALMNELAIIFEKMGIKTLDVIEAASTKWNFINMNPGLVGGHCIGVDPYYLTFKAEQMGYDPQVILSGRKINDSMGKYVAEKAIKLMIDADKPIKRANVLIMGMTFKENISDIRNSKVIDIVHELEGYGAKVLVHDPYANPIKVYDEYQIPLLDFSAIESESVDVVIVAVPHKEYRNESKFKEIKKILTAPKIVMDIKGIYRNEKKENINYWSF